MKEYQINDLIEDWMVETKCKSRFTTTEDYDFYSFEYVEWLENKIIELMNKEANNG